MNTERLYLLIVEDEAAHIEAIRRAYEATGADVEIRSVGTLREYRACVQERPPDLALVDLNLPDGRAVEVLTHPPEDAPFPILVMTAFGNQQIVVEVMKAGALDYVVKSPEAFALMPRTVEKALREWKLLQKRKQAEETLRESEARFRSLVENMSSAVSTYEVIEGGKDFVFKGFNKAGEQIERIRREDVIGRRVTEVFPGVRDFGILDVFERVWKTGVAERFPVALYRDKRIQGWRDNFIYKLPSGEVVTVYDDVTERKQAEEALRESEEKFSKAFRISSYAITLTHLEDGRFIDINEAFTTFTGYTKAEALADSSIGLKLWVHEEDRARVVADLRAGTSVLSREYLFWTKNGKILTCLFSAVAVQLGPDTCILSSTADITARKLAEMDLKKSMDFLDSVINAIADPVLVKDDQRRFVLVNDALCAIVGRPREGLLGEDGDDMFPKNQVEVFREMDYAVLATGVENVNEESLSNLSTGAVRTIVTRKTRYIDPAGKKFLVGIIRDITERKRAEEAQQASEKCFSTVFRASPLSIAIARLKDGTFVDVNVAWEKMTGFAREKAIGRKGAELNIWVDAGQRERLVRSMRGPERLLGFEVQMRQKSGAVREVLISAEQIRFADEPCMLTMALDITARKRAEEELRKFSGRLMQAQEEERRRISRELHDSTLQDLAAVAMQIMLLAQRLEARDGTAADWTADVLAVLEKTMRELRTLTHMLHPPLLDEIGLVDALRQYADEFAERSGLKLTVEVDSRFPHLPREAEMALFRVAQEALTNVHRHSGSKTVAVRLHCTAETVGVEIEDFGCGLPPHLQATPVEHMIGAGIGLAGMRERLLQLGGRLELQSGPTGTMVRAVLTNKEEA